MATTQISGVGNLVVNAYDTYVRAALRSLPVMRSVADVRPVALTNPGTTLKFAVYANLAAATTALTETSDVTPVALANPSQVTVTVTEYGNAVEQTEKVNMATFSSIDTMIGDAIAYNAADTLDQLVATALTSGTVVKYGGSRTSTATLTATDVLSTTMLRKAQTALLEANAQPRVGDLYTLFIHPRQAFDLRAETGSGGFVDIHKYTTENVGNLLTGTIGVLEGFQVVQTSRVPSATSGASSATVYSAVAVGKEALLEANVYDVQTVVAPQIDILRRK
ncbi:MAG: N4-gp56 family major capsid protein, partial [Micrococcales bacterium]|nr:N4-gp56 family major capsid protein [Micrococcales bacterium]